MRRSATLAIAAVLAAGCAAAIPRPGQRPPPIPEVSNAILHLIDAQDKDTVSSKDYASTSLGAISQLGTPAGLVLKLRYQEIGVALVETLKLSRDPGLLSRMFELAQFSHSTRIRSEALVTLGEFSDPADYQRFQLAISDTDVAIRFAAVEALQKWGREGATDLLRQEVQRPWSPLMQVFAAQALVSLGDRSGVPVLIKALDDNSWIVRAMAARYLGDRGSAQDFDVVFSALTREGARNDFVSAELCIASLKLLAKRPPPAGAAAAKRGAAPGGGGYVVASDEAVEMEPLVLRPPRLEIPESVRVAQVINSRLLSLIRSNLRLTLPKTLADDPNMQDLLHMVTPEGFALQTRYSAISVAIAEGLAGTTDALLRQELISLADPTGGANPVARATALVSLAYGRDETDVGTIETALSDTDPVIRFGAMEAAQAGRFKELSAQLIGIANEDTVPAFRVYATQVLLSFGDPSAHDLLQSAIYEQTDWPAKAMAFWYLGRYGENYDQVLAVRDVSQEQNPFVLAEAALASQRLAK